MAGGNKQAVLSQLTVSHVLLAFAKVVELLVRYGGRRERLEIPGFEALDDGGGAAAVEQPLEEAVLFACGFGSQPEVLATQMEMFTRVHEIIGEDGVGKGVAQCLFKGFFPVCEALDARCISTPPGEAQFANQDTHFGDILPGDCVGEGASEGSGAPFGVKPGIFAKDRDPDLAGSRLAVLALSPGGIGLGAGRPGPIQHAEEGMRGWRFPLLRCPFGVGAHVGPCGGLLPQARVPVRECQGSELCGRDGHAGETAEHVAAFRERAAQRGTADRMVARGGGTSSHNPQGLEQRGCARFPDIGVADGDPADARENLAHPIPVGTRRLDLPEA